MKSTIYGSGANSTATLYRIHQGECYFRKDSSTRHSQVMLLQTVLISLGYDCGTPDGKYGSKATAGVRRFQRANGLAVDGLFGKASLAALESVMGNMHLTDGCFDSDDLSTYGCYDDTNSCLNAAKYKVSSAMRVKSFAHALDCIAAFEQTGNPISVAEFLNQLDAIASDLEISMQTRTVRTTSMPPATDREHAELPANWRITLSSLAPSKTWEDMTI